MKIKLAVLLPLLLSGCIIPFPMVSRNKLPAFSGKVRDSENQPVSKATVVIVGHPETQAMTDSRGEFVTNPSSALQFTLLGPEYTSQKFRMTVQAPGYSSITFRIFRPPTLQVFGLKGYPIRVPEKILKSAESEES